MLSRLCFCISIAVFSWTTDSIAIGRGDRPLFVNNRCPFPIQFWVQRYSTAEGWVVQGPWRIAEDDFRSGKGPDQGALLSNGTVKAAREYWGNALAHNEFEPIFIYAEGGRENTTAAWSDLAGNTWDKRPLPLTGVSGSKVTKDFLLVPINSASKYVNLPYRMQIGAGVNGIGGVGIDFRCPLPGNLP